MIRPNTYNVFSFSWKWCCLNSPYLHNFKFIVITVFLKIFHIHYLRNPKHVQIELGIVLISSKHDSEMLNFQPSIHVYLTCFYCCVTNSFHQKACRFVNGYASGQRKHCMIGGHCMLMLPLCGKGVLKAFCLVPSTH